MNIFKFVIYGIELWTFSCLPYTVLSCEHFHVCLIRYWVFASVILSAFTVCMIIDILFKMVPSNAFLLFPGADCCSTFPQQVNMHDWYLFVLNLILRTLSVHRYISCSAYCCGPPLHFLDCGLLWSTSTIFVLWTLVVHQYIPCTVDSCGQPLHFLDCGLVCSTSTFLGLHTVVVHGYIPCTMDSVVHRYIPWAACALLWFICTFLCCILCYIPPSILTLACRRTC